jgi:hypothetical protein
MYLCGLCIGLVCVASPVVKSDRAGSLYCIHKQQRTDNHTEALSNVLRRPAEWWKGVVGDDGGTSPLDLGHFT